VDITLQLEHLVSRRERVPARSGTFPFPVARALGDFTVPAPEMAGRDLAGWVGPRNVPYCTDCEVLRVEVNCFDIVQTLLSGGYM
jgi:hypothetical protein